MLEAVSPPTWAHEAGARRGLREDVVAQVADELLRDLGLREQSSG